jgi:hypothetical protein
MAKGTRTKVVTLAVTQVVTLEATAAVTTEKMRIKRETPLEGQQYDS